MLVEANDVTLWVERDGPGRAIAVLLVSGADSPAARWTAAYVDPLVAAGFQVIWYDQRDVGRSQVMAADEPYRLDDLARDAVGVLDHLGIGSAHVVGRSMGGMIGQLLAIDHADRVDRLVLMSTTPGLGDDRLPPADAAVVDALAHRLWAPPPVGRSERIEWLVDGYRIFSGPRHGFEEALQRALAETEVDLAWRPETGHGAAVGASAGRLDRLAAVGAPTLVIHGTTDKVFTRPHADALLAGVPDAKAWWVEGLGHEAPDALAPELTNRVIRFLGAGGPPGP